ncbi:hypothetical protein E2C01_007129 [Portunus trituberculatus]|uniref:Uncharacterized protein n=1 Tax=Portunus trituberculatus TaxID=210409 RepID=A0A5B7D3M9_PORTR|nr:hypothetical protein [Portunus trituberculatus]
MSSHSSIGLHEMPPTHRQPRSEVQRHKSVSRYYDLLKCFLLPARFLTFSTVAKAPLQGLSELRHRAPLPQLAQDLGFLQQMGVIEKTFRQNMQARYYVDLHRFKNALQERVSQIASLVESQPEHLKWSWLDTTPDQETLPPFLRDVPQRQAVMRVLDVLNTQLAQMESEFSMEEDLMVKRRCDENISCLQHSVETQDIEAAKICQARYNLLAKPWISSRSAHGNENQYKWSSIRLLLWMEAEVWKERVAVSLEDFFTPKLHLSCIRQVLNLLIARGETLLAPLIGQRDAYPTYTVLDERVVDCVLDQCVMAGLLSEDGTALCPLAKIKDVVKKKLLIDVSLGQVRRVISHLQKSDPGFEGMTKTVTGAEAVMWATPIWLKSKQHFVQYLEIQDENGHFGDNFLCYLHKLMARCCLEVMEPGQLVARPPLFFEDEVLRELDNVFPQQTPLDEILPKDVIVFTLKYREPRHQQQPAPDQQQEKAQQHQQDNSEKRRSDMRGYTRPHVAAKEKERLLLEEGKYLPPLHYHCKPLMAAAFRRLCLMEKELADRGIGTWILDRYGVSVFVYEPLPLDSIHFMFGAATPLVFQSVRKVLSRLMEEILGMNHSGIFFTLRSNIHRNMKGLLKQAGILGQHKQLSEMVDEESPSHVLQATPDEANVYLTKKQKEAAADVVHRLKGEELRLRSKIKELQQKLRYHNNLGKHSLHSDIAALGSQLQETIQVKNKLCFMLTTEVNTLLEKWRRSGAPRLDCTAEWTQRKEGSKKKEQKDSKSDQESKSSKRSRKSNDSSDSNSDSHNKEKTGHRVEQKSSQEESDWEIVGKSERRRQESPSESDGDSVLWSDEDQQERKKQEESAKR